MWNDRIRLTSFWAIAPNTPTTTVNPATHASRVLWLCAFV